jgi:hypothetical protein
LPQSASLTIPVHVRSDIQVSEISAIFGSSVGSSDIAVDRASGKVTLRYHFPGDIDAIMRQLYARGLTSSATLALAVAVRPANGHAVDAAGVVRKLNASPAISNASFDGKVVCATVAAATETMRAMRDTLSAVGLEPS